MSSPCLNPSPDIVASFHGECFPGCGSLTFGYVLDRLVETCAGFRWELLAGNWVEKVEAVELSATNGFTSRVFRFTICLNNATAQCSKQQLIVKVFSLDRVDELVCKLMGGKQKMEEMMDEMEQMMRTEQQQKKEQQNDENGDGNATERIGINQCDQPDDELPKKPVNGQAAKKEENAYAQQQGAEEGEGDEQPYAFHHHDFFMQMHRNECTFYEYIKRNAAEKQWATPVPEVYFTQLGLAQQLERGTGADEGETMTTTTKTTKENGQAVEGQRNGLILMEDMSAQTHMLSFVDGPNEEQCLEIATHLAHLHAYFLAAANDSGNADWKELFLRASQMFGSKESKSKMFELMRAQLQEGAQRDGLLGPLNRMQRILRGTEYDTWATAQCQDKYGVPELVVHGDLWVNNVLWRNDDPNRVAAFIDWQLTVIGNPMVDLAHFMLLCADPTLRHRMEADNHIFAHYISALQTKLAERGLPTTAIGFGVEEIRHVYDLVFVEQALAAIFIVPFFQRAWAQDADFSVKMERLMPRTVAALEDAIRVLEAEAPEWLDDAKEEEEGEKAANANGDVGENSTL